MLVPTILIVFALMFIAFKVCRHLGISASDFADAFGDIFGEIIDSIGSDD